VIERSAVPRRRIVVVHGAVGRDERCRVTTSQGDGSHTGTGGRYPADARQRGTSWDDAPSNRPDRSRFGVVLRGYDRIEVDEYVGEVERQVAQLRSELVRSDDRLRRAEQRVEAVERENRAVHARLDTTATAAPAAPLSEGFGMRAERLLRLAEQEAAAVRAEAAEEAVQLRQQVREDVERQRHEAEQALIARSAQFDERTAQRTAELARREQQVAEQVAAARDEAEAVQSAAHRVADELRRRAEVESEEARARAAAEVAALREQAAQELDRITALQSGVRAELQRLSTRLGQEIARAPVARDDATRTDAGSDTGAELAPAGAGEAHR
jgi:DivIVA domain-containing protein